MREFERFNTVIANAYVQPMAQAYLGRLVDRHVGDQLAVGGRLVIPVGSYSQDLVLVTRCFDDACASEGNNGLWAVPLSPAGVGRASAARHLGRIPYAWGAQVVPSLGVLVLTDGEDILTVPLRASGLGGT